MKLLTKEIISKFEKHPFHSQDGKGMDAEVLVKYFNPCGTGTWLITEAEREGDDWRLFGYCHIHEWEWGCLMLSELASIPFPSCEWIGCFSNFEMICFVSSVIENKISDCPERPDSKRRIAAVSDKDKALP